MWRERVVYEPAIEKPCYVIGGSQHAVIYVDDETAQIYYYHSITPDPVRFHQIGDVEDRNVLKLLEYAPPELKAEIEAKLEEIRQTIHERIDKIYENSGEEIDPNQPPIDGFEDWDDDDEVETQYLPEENIDGHVIRRIMYNGEEYLMRDGLPYQEDPSDVPLVELKEGEELTEDKLPF